MSVPSYVNPKMTTIVVIFAVFLSTVHAKCPSRFCFYSKASADRLCKNIRFKSQCEVVPCTGRGCSKGGFRCEPKVTVSSKLISKTAVRKIRSEIRQGGGCKGNVCFAIDGSGSINAQEYRDQLDFVTGVLDVISPFATRVAGTQYSDKSYPIKPLSTDFNAFKVAMNSAKQKRRSTYISSGIRYCFDQLKGTGNELKKVVGLGDGFQNVDTQAIAAADQIRNIAVGFGSVAVVAVEQANEALLEGIAGGDTSLVFKANSFADSQVLGEYIRDLSLAICGLPVSPYIETSYTPVPITL